MGQGTKNALIGLALFSIKVLTTLRTALDTYAVSGDLLNVALIDGAFLALWLVVAYGGSGKQALAIRPYAWGGAIALYALMIAIGIEAHRGIMAVAVRVAGGSALLYDGIDYVITLGCLSAAQGHLSLLGMVKYWSS